MTTGASTSVFDVGAILDGKYRIERVLGQGGMGVVYAAHHELLAQSVALKVVLPEIAMNPEVVARFLQEARAAAKIDSDHVARVMDVGRLDDGTPFIVMELLTGRNLEEILEKDGPLPPQLLADYILQALDGLAQAHAMGLVHRDLKPANLFLAQKAGRAPRVKVLDFGISKALADSPLASAQVTSTQSILGSPGFMAPEQLRSSKHIDTRADIWSLGVILYQLATGRMPFDASTVGSLFASILEDLPVPPREVRPDIPEALEKTILRCLEKKPEARFANVLELAAALAPLGSATSARALQQIERLSMPTLETAPAFSPVGTLPGLQAPTGDRNVEAFAATRDSAPPQASREPALKTDGNWASRPGLPSAVAPRSSRTVTVVAVTVGAIVLFIGVAAVVGSNRDDVARGPTASSSAATAATGATAADPTAARTSELPAASTTAAAALAAPAPPATGAAPVDSASPPGVVPVAGAPAPSAALPQVPTPTKKKPAVRSDPDDLFSRH